MTDISRERAFLAKQGLDIIRRETWGAVQSYTSDRTVFEPVEGFVLHISVTADPADTPAAEAAACRTVERIGQERFGIGCSYNAGTMQSGRLYEMQPLTRRGAHTVDDKNVGYKSTGSGRSMNYWWRACVLVQNVGDPVTAKQIDSAARWAAAQIRAGYARRDAVWIGHRDVAWKSCPGDSGYARLPELRRLTEHYVRNGLGEDDMPLNETDKVIISNLIRQELYGSETAHSQGVTPIIRNEVRAVMMEMFPDGYTEAFGKAMQVAVGKTKGADGEAAAQVRARSKEGSLEALEEAGLYVPPAS